MPEICVAHLVRAYNGIEPFRSFLQSYRKHVAGIDHDLMIVFKGFERAGALEPFQELLNGVTHKTFFLSDEGFDIGSYFMVAQNFNYPYFCFLNSFSVILEQDWLAKMYGHVIQPKVGVVGATASYESHYSNTVKQLAKPFPELRPLKSFLRRWAGYQIRQKKLRAVEHQFAAFPNYHLRTNTFMISRSLMLSLRWGRFCDKGDAERFESGRHGLTQQIHAQGLQASVVGRNGEAYPKEQWYLSRTFRSGNQENLLVADNRTRQYEEANQNERQMMAERSWGNEQAREVL